jgi:hypothetical protein
VLHCCIVPHCRLQEDGLSFLGAFPEDAMLRAVRLDEVLPALEAQLMFGSNVALDQVRLAGSSRVLEGVL